MSINLSDPHSASGVGKADDSSCERRERRESCLSEIVIDLSEARETRRSGGAGKAAGLDAGTVVAVGLEACLKSGNWRGLTT